jgi:anti-anti-sigma regulatory factor
LLKENIMGTLLLEGYSTGLKLTAAGRLTIEDVSRLRALLVEAYASEGNLFIDLTKAHSIGLECAQVLCSANITYRKAGRIIGISLVPGCIKQSLTDIALTPAACGLETHDSCLWATGIGT